MSPSRLVGARAPTAVVLGILMSIAAVGCTSVLDLKVGDCYDGDDETEVTTVQSKACTEPHDAEVFANLTHPDSAGAFPGQFALQQYAERECINAFDDYVGLDYQSSELLVSYLTPTDDGWGRGDHIVTCVITAAEGEKLTGSMKDRRL